MKFRIIEGDKKTDARAGELQTKHGVIKTPAFMPVATKAAVKTLTSEDMQKLGAQILMCNTYHLNLKPGVKVIEKFRGLHKFINWDKPIITDSAGFQSFSLGFGLEYGGGKIGSYFPEDNAPKKGGNVKKLAKVTDEGVRFNSIYDNRPMLMTPEKSMKIQEALGADIMIAFDECTSPYSDHKYTMQSLKRTHLWAERCIKAHKTRQALSGVIQGGAYKDLRKESAEFISSLKFDMFAIGGSLGRSKKEMHNVLEWVMDELPKKKAVHLLGIGTVEDIFESVERGIDLFDCVGPTRMARSGYAYISQKAGGTLKNKFRLKISKQGFVYDKKPIDPYCGCFVCRNYSRAYIRHLFKANEMTAYSLTSYHNLYFFLALMRQIRESIVKDEFLQLKRAWLG